MAWNAVGGSSWRDELAAPGSPLLSSNANPARGDSHARTSDICRARLNSVNVSLRVRLRPLLLCARHRTLARLGGEGIVRADFNGA